MPRPFGSSVELAAEMRDHPKTLSAPVPPHEPSSSVAASSCSPPRRTPLRTRASLPNSIATATPSASGVNASSPMVLLASRTPLAPGDLGELLPPPPNASRSSPWPVARRPITTTSIPPGPWTSWRSPSSTNAPTGNASYAIPRRCSVTPVRTSRPTSPVGRFPSLPRSLIPPGPSRSTIWRILDEIDLKPHESVYRLNRHDPDFDAKAQDICGSYLDAQRFYAEGRLILSSDEKTGTQALGRPHPTREARPGRPAKVEFDHTRHGTRCLLNTFCVPTGEVVWDLLAARTSVDRAAHLRHVAGQFPGMKRYDWVVDDLNTHSEALEVRQRVAESCDPEIDERPLGTGAQGRAFLTDESHKVVFHFTPIHGSWLNQVELFFRVVARRFLRRRVFGGMAEFEGRSEAWLEEYDSQHAPAYQWTYAGKPLVRGTPFSQARRQQKQGRAWFGTRPSLFEHRLYPPRPYKRKKPRLAANL